MMDERIPDRLSYPSKHVEVYGSKMHYIEAGAGNPIVFLHGIPTSCYLWRNVIPYLTSLGRCIAPDLIGCGWSDKPDIEYSVQDHIKYIDKFIETLNLKNVTLVMHGLGSIVGFDYAMRHEKNCKGLVFYEAFLKSLQGEELSLPLQEQLIILQDQKSLEELSKNGAAFIDHMLPQDAIRHLTEVEMNNYRQPFADEGTTRPILQYLKELPMGEKGNKVEAIIANYSEKLTHSTLPKLLLYSFPGFITTIAAVMWAKENLPNLEVIDIGEELHLAQESCPHLMGETISVWLQGVEQGK